MEKIVFEDAEITKPAQVTINGVDYEVQDAEIEGGTELNADTFNTLQDNVENAINEDTGWIELTLQSGFTEYESGVKAVCRRRGKVVQVKGVVKPTAEMAAGSSGHIFTLPNDMKPSKHTYNICQGSGTNRWLFTIDPQGRGYLGRYGANTTVVVPSNAWLVMDAVYLVD